MALVGSITGSTITAANMGYSGAFLQRAYNNFNCNGVQLYTTADLYWKAWTPTTTTLTSKGTNSYWTAAFTTIAASRGAAPISFDIWYEINSSGTWYSLDGNGTTGGGDNTGGLGVTGFWTAGSSDDWIPVNMTISNTITAAAGSTIKFRVYIRNGGPSTDLLATNNMIGHEGYFASMTVSEVRG